jgi:molybdopterin-containing oxidoreductase family iron-sulfur binding subunit
VVARQSENNVPTVGKAQVAYGRISTGCGGAMAGGHLRQPVNMFLPMFCQHCEIAPCEPVCPVYRRLSHARRPQRAGLQPLWGTATAATTAPTVRKFNWFNYT